MSSVINEEHTEYTRGLIVNRCFKIENITNMLDFLFAKYLMDVNVDIEMSYFV